MVERDYMVKYDHWSNTTMFGVSGIVPIYLPEKLQNNRLMLERACVEYAILGKIKPSCSNFGMNTVCYYNFTIDDDLAYS